MSNREKFINSVNKFNVGNKYNFSQEVLWAEEGLVLLEEPDKYKNKINFSVFDNELIDLDPEIVCFQCSLRKSYNHAQQFALPYSFERFNEKFDVIKSGDNPSVGFCGNYIVHPDRTSCLFDLQRDKSLNTNFIWRWTFQASDIDTVTAKKEFKENMQSNAFNVCMRGNGNFSIRFYETLSCGRVPVLVDTDCVFPFDDVLDYSEFCIIAENNEDLSNEILRKWNDESYIEMQNRAYEVYHDYFHLDIVGKRIVEYLDRNL